MVYYIKMSLLMIDMNQLNHYINDILGISLNPEPVPKGSLNHLPLYIREAYRIYDARIYNQPLLLAALKENNGFSNLQIEKHMNLIGNSLNKKVILVSNSMTAINRRRLIEKNIDFIVPGKQLFMPNMLLDFKENFNEDKGRKNKEKLLPSAQYILLYYIEHRNDKVQLTDLSFKKLAEKLGYTQMGITKAVENLRIHDLCAVSGIKEKYIRFDHDRNELWDIAHPHLVNPVLKKVYVDIKPDVFMLQSNVSALPEYSDLNPGSQAYYAMEKIVYYGLQKSGTLINENTYEGRYCLEVWKYNPLKLAEGITEGRNVDPLSLYLSLKDTHDERIEMALEQIIEKYIW